MRKFALIVCIALAMRAGSVAGWQAQATGSPRVSAEFQSEIASLASEGLTVKEALEASLGGGARHLAAIFERAKPKQPSESHEFRIIESDGRTARTIFRRAEFFFSFGTAAELAKLNATDINGDGLKEIIVQSSSGGNCWGCNPTEIYQVRDHKGTLIAAGPVQRIADINNDGTAELIVADARWEVYGDLSHAAAPLALMVYAWHNGRYVYASRDFSAYYKGEIERLRASINEAKAQITSDEFSDEAYIGRAISLAITYAHTGELEAGLKELESSLKSNARSPEQSSRRAAIIEDFQKGESGKKLREMRYGDPLQ